MSTQIAYRRAKLARKAMTLICATLARKRLGGVAGPVKVVLSQSRYPQHPNHRPISAAIEGVGAAWGDFSFLKPPMHHDRLYWKTLTDGDNSSSSSVLSQA